MMKDADAAIKTAVEQFLERSSRVDHREVQVAVRDAVVTLDGTVDSAIEKRAARELAQDTEGVERVDDRLAIRNYVERTDAELAEEVRNALARDAYVEGTKIEVYANRGRVRLDGSVPTYHIKKAIEDVTWWTPGVVDVESLLLVSEEDFVDVSPGEVVG